MFGHRLLLSTTVAAVTVATAGAAAPVEQADAGCAQRWWPQPRQSACANGSAANPLAPSPDNVAGLKLAWTYDAGIGTVGQPIVWASPEMGAALVYAVNGGRLHAVELATGRLRWRAKAGAGDPVDGTQPVADRDLLLRLTDQGVLRRYVPRSGHIVWQRTVFLENWPERQVVADGNWYMVADWHLLAYNARTGRPRWSRAWDCFHCGVAAYGGRVYVAGVEEVDGEGKGALSALNAGTGETLWRTATVASSRMGAWPMLAGGTVFVRTMGGREGRVEFAIEAFRAADGKHLWRAAVGTAAGFWFTPAAASSELVVSPSENGRLYAVDAQSGALRWNVPGINFRVRPAVVNGLVWAGDEEGRVVALDARDGRLLWASPSFGKDSPVSPVLAGRFLVIGAYDGRLLAYRVP